MVRGWAHCAGPPFVLAAKRGRGAVVAVALVSEAYFFHGVVVEAWVAVAFTHLFPVLRAGLARGRCPMAAVADVPCAKAVFCLVVAFQFVTTDAHLRAVSRALLPLGRDAMVASALVPLALAAYWMAASMALPACPLAVLGTPWTSFLRFVLVGGIAVEAVADVLDAFASLEVGTDEAPPAALLFMLDAIGWLRRITIGTGAFVVLALDLARFLVGFSKVTANIATGTYLKAALHALFRKLGRAVPAAADRKLACIGFFVQIPPLFAPDALFQSLLVAVLRLDALAIRAVATALPAGASHCCRVPLVRGFTTAGDTNLGTMIETVDACCCLAVIADAFVLPALATTYVVTLDACLADLCPIFVAFQAFDLLAICTKALVLSAFANAIGVTFQVKASRAGRACGRVVLSTLFAKVRNAIRTIAHVQTARLVIQKVETFRRLGACITTML